MYSRQIFGALILTFTFAQAQSAPSVASAMISKLEELQKSVVLEKNIPQRIKLFEKSLSEVKKIKKDRQAQITEDEKMIVDTMLAGLDLIPTKDFDRKKCDQYKHKLKFELEPTAETSPVKAGVADAYETLEALCK